jgi:hypothetical protein
MTAKKVTAPAKKTTAAKKPAIKSAKKAVDKKPEEPEAEVVEIKDRFNRAVDLTPHFCTQLLVHHDKIKNEPGALDHVKNLWSLGGQ